MPQDERKDRENTVNIMVSVDEQHREELNSVARRLESVGMTVAEVFPISGVIAGAAASGDLTKLRSVQGVASVEEEPAFDAQGSSE